MKHKTVWIIALVAMPLLAAVFILHAQTNDRETEAWSSFINDMQSRIDAAEFDLQFTITDTDDKPLNGVKVEIRWSRPVPKLALSGGMESENEEEKTVKPTFHIHKKGWTGLELTFRKSGYYIEQRGYGIEFMPDQSDELGPDGKPKTLIREKIQVKMYKGVPAADMDGTRGMLQYDLEKGQKTVCDLSLFGKKQEKPKKTAISEEDEEDEDGEYDEEEEKEEEEEEGKINMRTIDLKTKPEPTEYIELDFKRDEKGEILFDGMLGGRPCPASLIIRLRSDNPDDGFVLVDQLKSGFVRRDEYDKRYQTAPETGYKKEIEFDLGKKGADGKYPDSIEANYWYAFVKYGLHYGRIFFNPVSVEFIRNGPLGRVRLNIEPLDINRVEGDRNVSNFHYFVDEKKPEETKNIPDKKEAKNEAENAPDDKAETAKKMIKLLGDALQQYKLDVGTYPSDLQGLMRNIDETPRWDGPYIRPNVPLDPWGNEFRYDMERGTYRLSSSGLSETVTGDPPKRVQQTEPGDRKEPDIFAGLPLWVASRDGKPEVMLRRLVNEATKRAGAKLQPLGDVKFTPIDADHSYADLDLDIVDEYAGIVRFIREIESYMPHLSWRRLELRVNSARERIAAELQGDASAAASGKSFRLSARIRAITDTPAAGSSASTNGKRMDDAPPAVGDTDVLSLLYSLSLMLPDDALVTDFRLTNGKCDFVFQTQDRDTDPSRCLIIPYWQLARLQRRAVSDDVIAFTVALARKIDLSPRKETVSPENKIKTTVALNIFDPDSAPRREAGRNRPASNDTSTNNAKDPEAELKQQLQKAINNQNELKELLKTLSKTPGATKEQTDLVRQRLERNEQEIRRLREQMKKLRP